MIYEDGFKRVLKTDMVRAPVGAVDLTTEEEEEDEFVLSADETTEEEPVIIEIKVRVLVCQGCTHSHSLPPSFSGFQPD